MSRRLFYAVLATAVVAVHSSIVGDWNQGNSTAALIYHYGDGGVGGAYCLPIIRRLLTPMAVTTLWQWGMMPTLAKYFLSFLSLWAAFGAVDNASIRLGGNPGKASALLAAFIILHTAVFDVRGFWPDRFACSFSDLTAPLFFAGLLLTAIEGGKWPKLAWFVLMIVGTFNRETTVCLIPIGIVAFGWVAGFASLLLWVAVKVVVNTLYPGETLGMSGFMSNTLTWLAFLSTKDWLWLVGILCFSGVLFWFRPRNKMQAAMVLSCVGFLAAVFMFGQLWELRMFNEYAVIPATLFSLRKT